MKKLFSILMLISLLSIIPVSGQEIQETSEAEEIQETPQTEEEQKVKDVQEPQGYTGEIEINKGFFTTFKFNDGETIRKLNSGELEKIIVSIEDEEATRYFMKSKTLENESLGFGIVGGFLIGWSIGELISGKGFDMRIFGAGCGFTSVGLVIDLFSQKERVKSVERYNKVVKEEWGIDFQYLPEDKQLGFNLKYSF